VDLKELGYEGLNRIQLSEAQWRFPSERSDEFSDPIKGGKYLDQLNVYQFLN
jgi:hypothetical protein